MKRKVLALLLVLLFALSVTSMAVSARPGEEDDNSIIVDDFDRDDYKDDRIFTTGAGVIYWQELNENIVNQDDNRSIPIEDGALVLEYNQDMWWAISSSCFSAGYDYLCFRIKGEKGGEEEHLSLKFGDGDYADIGVSGQDKITDFVPADGTEIKITKDWSTIAIDMNASKIVQKIDGKEVPMLKTFNGIHLNSSAAGKIYIDCIWFTTDAKAKMPKGSYLKSEKKDSGSSKPAEEKTTVEEEKPAETKAPAKADKKSAKKDTSNEEVTSTDNTLRNQIIFYCLAGVAVIIFAACIIIGMKNKKEDK